MDEQIKKMANAAFSQSTLGNIETVEVERSLLIEQQQQIIEALQREALSLTESELGGQIKLAQLISIHIENLRSLTILAVPPTPIARPLREFATPKNMEDVRKKFE